MTSYFFRNKIPKSLKRPLILHPDPTSLSSFSSLLITSSVCSTLPSSLDTSQPFPGRSVCWNDFDPLFCLAHSSQNRSCDFLEKPNLGQLRHACYSFTASYLFPLESHENYNLISTTLFSPWRQEPQRISSSLSPQHPVQCLSQSRQKIYPIIKTGIDSHKYYIFKPT